MQLLTATAATFTTAHIAAITGSAVALGPASTVPPPPAPGAWHQLGAAVTSRPGKGLHFFRLSGATRCYVSVHTRAPGPAARTAGAEFSY
jgi:hypothetical protein